MKLMSTSSPEFLMSEKVPPSFLASDEGRIDRAIEQAAQHVDESKNIRADALYGLATFVVLESQVASVGLLQRRLKLGYAQACELMAAMERDGVVSRHLGEDGLRDVLLTGERRTESLNRLRGKAFQFGIGRDPDRIVRVLEEIRLAWQKCPDMRLGQLVVLAANPLAPCPEIFQIEDAELADAVHRIAVG